ncbi:MAG: Na+/H+ antiporter subunit E [Spirochaetota bacterium]
MRFIAGRISAAVMLAGIWALLMHPLTGQEILAGIGITFILIITPITDTAVFGELRITPKRVLFALVFLVVFLVEVVKSNIDVATRVLKPVIPLKPGIVRVQTRLTSRLGRLLLANAITLTPGTITVDILGQDLFIHWIYVDAVDIDEATKKIVLKFERYLEVIFG